MLGEGMKRRRQPVRRKGAARETGGRRFSVWRWLLAGLIAVVVAFGAGYLVATLVLFPQPALAGDEIAVPDLIGMPVADAREQLETRNLRLGEVRSMAHPSTPVDVVIAQAPLSDQRLKPGAAVRIAVSSGPASIVVPDLEGLPFESARELAVRVGFSVTRRDEMDPAPAGVILRTQPAAGTSVEAPAELTLVVSQGAPQVEDTLLEADTLLDGFMPSNRGGDRPSRPGEAGERGADPDAPTSRARDSVNQRRSF